jgi:hypothetical protein
MTLLLPMSLPSEIYTVDIFPDFFQLVAFILGHFVDKSFKLTRLDLTLPHT